MAKKKKRQRQSEKPSAIEKSATQKPAPKEKHLPPKKEKTEKNSITTFLFGHPKIDKKDIIEIIIIIIFTAFFLFMHLKTNEII